MALVLEFFTTLGKVVWYTLLALVKLFLPVAKKDVRGDIVLVTGAGSGIGRLIAIRFAELGAKVVLLDINEQANSAVADEINASGNKAYAYACDCSKREAIYQTAAHIKQDVGAVTILVNNAGVISGKELCKVPDEKIELTMQVNTMAHFWTLKAFLPSMIANNHGHIINIASSAGLFGVSKLVDYSTSKFAAVGIHESLNSELSTLNCDGVHCLCVCPYFIDTGMFDGVKTRVPALLPILKPDYVVNKIMSAFHSNRNMILLPRILYLFLFLQSFLPKEAMMVAGGFFGANVSMDTFKGREKKE